MAFRSTNKTQENKLRAYPIRGYERPYWGVTSILGYVFGIPSELNRWSVKVAMQSVFTAEKLAKTEGKKKLTQKARLEIAQQARKDYLENARVKGTTIHDYIEERLKTGKEPEGIQDNHLGYYTAFSNFLSHYEIETLIQEETVWDDENLYAGRIDWYGRINFGGVWKLVLIDFKTSNFTKPSYGLQLAAYKHALELRGYIVEETYILHLRPNGTFELKLYMDTFEDFLNVIKVFNWKYRQEKPEMFWATDLGALKAEIESEAEDESQ